MKNASWSIAAAGLLFASAGVAARLGPAGTPAPVYGAARLLVGGLVLAAALRPRVLLDALRALPVPALAMAASGMALFQWSFFAAVDAAGVGVASLASAGASPLCADLLEAARLRSSPGPSLVAAALFTALAMMSLGCGGVPASGLALAVLSALSYAPYAAAAARLERARAGAGIASTALALLLAGAVLAPPALTGARSLFSPAGILVAAYLGAGATALAYKLFVAGLREVSPGRALAILLVQPLSAVVLGAALLGEPINHSLLAGSACLALALASRASQFRSTPHQGA